MSAATTTHLICAPGFDGSATVTRLHHPVGAHVAADVALLTLTLADGSRQDVAAPEAGVLAAFTAEIGDRVLAGELLALMDIEEAPTGWLFPPEPAGIEAAKDSSGGWLTVSVDAARLAARLGVDLSELADQGRIDVADVEHYVREQLAQRR
ncbi:hypothetical protein JHS3_26760 [Jeongeupia sp. HS-3]|uniref:hypothetical protein n=1 Tax=Jeongeupia sp. HS-3 TaxID=1009682 RepID=UPI0018A417B8|nr:hypothetical protein [Jeongeupia sp. HS-3]BCL76940.1 hypothetical protein JHS3_26760 [Jeongeupia sp. HS-3]